MKVSCGILALAAVIGSVVTPVYAVGSEDEMPIVIDTFNFFEKVLDRKTNMVKGTKPWFIEFYAPWCPHCQNLAPTWDELYRRNKERVNIARVDCTSTNGKPLCFHYKVKGYPTMIFFPLGSSKTLHYESQRTLEAFESWLDKQLAANK